MTAELESLGGAWVLAAFSVLGPEPIVYWPEPMDEAREPRKGRLEKKSYLQVAVKSISLLLGDFAFEEGNIDALKQTHLFGVLPYPDFESIAFTYFRYYQQPDSKRYIPITLSLIVHESKRSFVYENNVQLEITIKKFTDHVLSKCAEKQIVLNRLNPQLLTLIQPEVLHFSSQLQSIHAQPINPIGQHRKIKIVFAGLEHSGKNSCLFALDHRFSQIITLPASQKPKNEPINIMGTTVIKWDIPEQFKLRDGYLENSELFLYETDVLYYFIDIRNPRLPSSKQVLEKIILKIHDLHLQIPILVVFTKVDADINQTHAIRETIVQIKRELEPLLTPYPHHYFEVSIFMLYSVLNTT